MKKYIIITMILSFCTSCFNPFLKWIDTPSDPSSNKAITAFSFGIDGEAHEIGTQAGTNGKIPIVIILPPRNDADPLPGPAITFIGRTLSPPSGETRDFSEPQTYRVTAEDDSYLDYEVTVYTRTGSSKAIIWFNLEIQGNLLAQGIVNEKTPAERGEISIGVPSGTDLSALTAKIVHTGASLTSPSGQSSQTVLTITSDFSATISCTVTAADATTKEYLVTVIRDRSGVKEITSFTFDGIQGEQTIIGGTPRPDGKIPILVTIPPPPAGTAGGLSAYLGALKPRITYLGTSITGPGSLSRGTGTANATAAVNFGDPADPPVYTVTAENGATKEYVVTVYAVDLNSGKQITGFYVFPGTPNEGVSGIIDEAAKTIVVTVPFGTDLSALEPVIYHTGVAVSPISGEPRNFTNSRTTPIPYTVTARDGTSQTYMVSVFPQADSAKEIIYLDFTELSGETVTIGLFPDSQHEGKIPIMVAVPYLPSSSGISLASLTPVITHTGNSISGGGVSSGGRGTVTGGAADFRNPVDYTVTAEDNTANVYKVTVIMAPNPQTNPADDAVARIDAFYFTDPVAIGRVSEDGGSGGRGSVNVTVPYGTDLNGLLPAIHYTGQAINLGTSPGFGPMDNPAVIGTNFSSLALYTVTAENGSTTKTYEVTVVEVPRPLRDDKEITAFTFDGVPIGNTITVIAGVPNAAGRTPIEITISDNPGYDLAALKPVITHTGDAITGPGIPAGGGPGVVNSGSATVDFSGSIITPLAYTVRAENGTDRVYHVTVRKEDDNAKEITGFYFTQPLAVGLIDQAAKNITVTVPSGTGLSALKPTVYYTGASLNPVSGGTNDFSGPVTYTVRARNGTSQPYTVRVSARPSGAKEITGLTFPGTTILGTIIGSVPDPGGNIPISITVAGNTDLTDLSPNITHTGRTISPASGSAQDFSGPVSYRVTAEDGSVKDYAVSVHRSTAGAKLITGFSFPELPGGGSATGSIDQSAGTIEVVVPRGTNITGLRPSVTYIGASVTPPGGTAQTANPYYPTGGVNFTGVRTYRVTAADNSYREYTVTVSEEERNLGVSVTFTNVSDPQLISQSFDQNTGLITITVTPSPDYSGPEEWYLDGQKYPVPRGENPLVLRAGDLPPGQHEVVVALIKSAVPSGHPAHYTNKVNFLVRE